MFCFHSLFVCGLPVYEIVFFYPLKALDKLKRQLAEAEAAVEARKKPPEEAGPRIIGEGLVIDEWVSSSCRELDYFSYKILFI